MNSLKVAVAQLPNNTDVTSNQALAVEAIQRLEPHRPDLIIFPECYLTGFSALVKDTDFDLVASGLKAIQNIVEVRDVRVFLPSVIKHGEKFYNAVYYLQPGCEPTIFYKEGLTDSETLFFTAGTASSRFIHINGFKLGYLICIEASKPAWSYFTQASLPDLILWSGYWGWDETVEWNPEMEKDSKDVFANMNEWRVPLVQTNFSMNAGSDPRSRGPAGRSVVVNADNSLRFRGLYRKNDYFIVNFSKTDDGLAVINGCTRIFDTEVRTGSPTELLTEAIAVGE